MMTDELRIERLGRGLDIHVRVTGMDDVSSLAARAHPIIAQALATALYRNAEATMTESKRIVPVETGTLRSSGHVQPPVVTGDNVQVTLGYGGAASAYAIVQHERLDYRHEPPGQAKYLEQPVRERAAVLARSLADEVARVLSKLARRKR